MAMALSSLLANAVLQSVKWLIQIHEEQSQRVTAWETEQVVRQTFQGAMRRLRMGLPWSVFNCDGDPAAQSDAMLSSSPVSTLSVVAGNHESAPSRAVADSDIISIRHEGCGGHFTEQYFVGRHAGGSDEASRGLYYRERWQGERWRYSQEVVLGLSRLTLHRCDLACQPGRLVPGFQPSAGVRLAFHWPEHSALPFSVSYLTLPTVTLRARTLGLTDESGAGLDRDVTIP